MKDEVQLTGGNVYVRRIKGIKAQKDEYIEVRMWLKGYEAILYRKEENGKYKSIVSAIIRSKRIKNDEVIYQMKNMTYYRTTNEKKAVLLRMDDLPRLTKEFDKMDKDWEEDIRGRVSDTNLDEFIELTNGLITSPVSRLSVITPKKWVSTVEYTKKVARFVQYNNGTWVRMDDIGDSLRWPAENWMNELWPIAE